MWKHICLYIFGVAGSEMNLCAFIKVLFNIKILFIFMFAFTGKYLLCIEFASTQVLKIVIQIFSLKL